MTEWGITGNVSVWLIYHFLKHPKIWSVVIVSSLIGFGYWMGSV